MQTKFRKKIEKQGKLLLTTGKRREEKEMQVVEEPGEKEKELNKSNDCQTNRQYHLREARAMAIDSQHQELSLNPACEDHLCHHLYHHQQDTVHQAEEAEAEAKAQKRGKRQTPPTMTVAAPVEAGRRSQRRLPRTQSRYTFGATRY